MIADRVHQVGLAETNAAIQEQRVVAVLGVVGNLPGGRTGKLVRLALDEILEGKGPVEVTGVLEPTFYLNVAFRPHRRRCDCRFCGNHGFR